MIVILSYSYWLKDTVNECFFQASTSGEICCSFRLLCFSSISELSSVYN